MNAVDVAVKMAVKKPIYFFIQKVVVFKSEVARYVLRLTMKSRSCREIHIARHVKRRETKRQRRHKVNVIHAVERFFDDLFIAFRYRNAVLFDVVFERPDVQSFHDIIIRQTSFVFVGAQNADSMPFFTKRTYKIHGSNGSSVVFFTEYVAHYTNCHYSKYLSDFYRPPSAALFIITEKCEIFNGFRKMMFAAFAKQISSLPLHY